MKVIWIVLVLFAGISAVGCERDEKPAENRVKIMYGGTERQFFTQYGNYFVAKFPEMDVEIISTEGMPPWPEEGKEYEKRMNAEKPDIVMLSSSTYTELSAKGVLLDLAPLIQRDRFDVDNIAPAVITTLSSTGNGGKLYGLGTHFTSSVLLYNKDLFKLYGVAEPEGSLSWEQLYAIMRHFSVTTVSREPVYGYHRPFMINPFSYVQEVANSGGLTLVNTSTREITIRTEGWRKAFQLVADGILGGSLGGGYRVSKGNVEQADTKNADLFGQGKAAMTIGNFQSVSNLLATPPAFDWGIAGAPASQPAEGMSQSMDVYPIFGIYAKADHVESAWRVVQYLNSDEVARINSGLKTGVLPVRFQYAPDLGGREVELFYRVASNSLSNARILTDYLTLPAAFRGVMGSIINEEFDKVLTGKATVDEALKRMQEREQAALDSAGAAEAK
ncbi:MAG: hypothetical protein K0Q73_8658 [Paenibacillus sp.]|nr:hypothetical protein [Paenibacillus sp.]